MNKCSLVYIDKCLSDNPLTKRQQRSYATELLTYLRLWCDARGHDYHKLEKAAYRQYLAEKKRGGA